MMNYGGTVTVFQMMMEDSLKSSLLLLLLAESLSLIERISGVVQVLSPGLYVGLLVCPVHCGKTADLFWTGLGMLSRLGPWMRQIIRVNGCPTGGGNLGLDVGHPIVTSGDFVA